MTNLQNISDQEFENEYRNRALFRKTVHLRKLTSDDANRGYIITTNILTTKRFYLDHLKGLYESILCYPEVNDTPETYEGMKARILDYFEVKDEDFTTIGRECWGSYTNTNHPHRTIRGGYVDNKYDPSVVKLGNSPEDHPELPMKMFKSR